MDLVILAILCLAAAAGILALFVILRAAAMQADAETHCADKLEPSDIDNYGAQEGLR